MFKGYGRHLRFFAVISAGVFLSLWTATVPVALAAQPGDKDLFLVAQKAFEDGFYDVDIRYIQQLQQQYPQTDRRVEANILLGQCYFFKGQYLKAYDIFHQLLGEGQFKDATLFWLGETYLKGGDYRQAEEQYSQVIQLYADSMYTPQAYYSLGWV
ncbi:MAG: tetratricopeptide repeat protein, partial [Candidatus Omnitrophica bacterium]|nr:tetratricopeptide repeat protein [Candidatus Omnitrophota bacterium]